MKAINIKKLLKVINEIGKKEYGKKFNIYEFIKNCRWNNGIPDDEYIKKTIKRIIDNPNADVLDYLLDWSKVRSFYSIDLWVRNRDNYRIKNILKLYDIFYKIKNEEKIKNQIKEKIEKAKRIKTNKKLFYNSIFKLLENGVIDKIGCEPEISNYRYNESYFYIYKSINNLISDVKEENGIIFELNITPLEFKNIKENLTFNINLIEDFNINDFDYREGEDDEYAESNHLHISFRKKTIKEKIYKDISIINSLLLFKDFYSRTGGDMFRDAISYRAFITKLTYLPNNSKDYWITDNSVGTLEIRLNENYFIVPITLLLEYHLYLMLTDNNYYQLVKKEFLNEIKNYKNSDFTSCYFCLKFKDIFDYLLKDIKEYYKNILNKEEFELTSKLLDIIIETINDKGALNINKEIYNKAKEEFKEVWNIEDNTVCFDIPNYYDDEY